MNIKDFKVGDKEVFIMKQINFQDEETHTEKIKGFVCTVEDFNGNKKDCRVFAATAEEARKQIIKKFPKCYVFPAVAVEAMEE